MIQGGQSVSFELQLHNLSVNVAKNWVQLNLQKSTGLWGLPPCNGKVKSFDKFDADFFGYTPNQVDYLDPQDRKLLEVTYEAILDAGNHDSISDCHLLRNQIIFSNKLFHHHYCSYYFVIKISSRNQSTFSEGIQYGCISRIMFPRISQRFQRLFCYIQIPAKSSYNDFAPLWFQGTPCSYRYCLWVLFLCSQWSLLGHQGSTLWSSNRDGSKFNFPTNIFVWNVRLENDLKRWQIQMHGFHR